MTNAPFLDKAEVQGYIERTCIGCGEQTQCATIVLESGNVIMLCQPCYPDGHDIDTPVEIF